MARRRRPFLRLSLGRQRALPERTSSRLSTRKLTGQNLGNRNLGNRNPWPVLAVLLLGLGLGVYLFYGQKGTQGDQRRELRKF
ncbi:hypothetical protein KQ302_12435 [Synechococcus sp. CS-602]|uniref:hypothetical protein n=1 Tax=Synechococcaceae TaxID=1890426 RepID=UPI0008FF533E|nr:MULTISPECIES: hypothetical protein [Synechococcaceae]MCT4363938.1 hypothetical protein [Candidatus Regnicoccus frigidus MAG-AL1]APD48442.1 hypothetical protein BM449_09600 [Synechococcus sp. SynAce01]MCT0201346.1 hypothetical protein [Synechococcus sp. CS-603]MCT0205896.1 hypothetical protein [Synechococcus sp. CS-602]MCT0246002.1 hypothetical protein [Synechococcus sp. CS-601]